MGFCTAGADRRGSSSMVPAVEQAMVDSGIILLKYWLEVSPEEQTRRLESRIDDPRKIWKLSDMDLQSYSRWYDYSRARDAMFAATDTAWAPWYVAHTDDKKRGRLNIISHLLSQVPYEPLQAWRRRAAEAAAAARLPAARPAAAAHPDPLLRACRDDCRAAARRVPPRLVARRPGRRAARGISRGDLKDLGEGLDDGSAAVIVLGESKIEKQLEQATKRANKLIEKQIDADADELKREIEAAGEGRRVL